MSVGSSVSQTRAHCFGSHAHLLLPLLQVLDVTRWLPEHPGGSRIIPKQALNLDCRRARRPGSARLLRYVPDNHASTQQAWIARYCTQC